MMRFSDINMDVSDSIAYVRKNGYVAVNNLNLDKRKYEVAISSIPCITFQDYSTKEHNKIYRKMQTKLTQTFSKSSICVDFTFRELSEGEDDY